jgi:acyl-CoA reductase-like NAD-dependent aldehyde dehydrogenase
MGSTDLSWTEFFNVVDGKNRSSDTFYQGINAATGEKLWDVPVASKQDTEDAILAARHAFKSWSAKPFEERRTILKKLGEGLKPYLDDFEELLLKESAKPRIFARGEVDSACVEGLEYWLSQSLPEQTLQEPDRKVVLKYVPLGVVAAILPWNFPLGQANMKFLPALLAGNTVIIKPSPFTPYSALKVVEIAQKFLPPGVLQVLGGDDKLGPWLVAHPGVDKISFTGSVATGKKIMEAASKTLKRVTLELGGNDACIICPDVDVDGIASQLVFGAFFNTGQICTATKRIYIHQDIYPQMLAALQKATDDLSTGDPTQKGVMIGPLQNKMQYDKVKTLYKESNLDEGFSGKGFYLKPTIVDSPPESSKLMLEEQMGPIVPTQSWTDEADVVARANDSSMGLGGSIWTKDPERAQRLADGLETGSVFINSSPKTSIKIPFSGHKESGIGVEAGSTAMLAYCNQKAFHYFG